MSQMPPRDALVRAVSHVTSTMLGFTFALPPPELDRPVAELMWRTALLSIPGRQPISVALSSNESGCAALGAAMFSCAPAALDASMIDDSLCELVNMTAGQIRLLMALDQALGLPRVGAGGGQGAVHEPGWSRLVLSSGPVALLLSLTNRSF
jgi:hypothetical protein